MSTTKITKAELIDQLVERGHHRPALTRLTLAGLQALVDEPQTAEQPEPAPAASGDLLVAIEDVQVGDVWCGTKVAAVQFGPKWAYLQSRQGTWFLRVPAGQKVQVTR